MSVAVLAALSLAALSLAALGACANDQEGKPSTLLIGTPTTFESVNELISQGSAFNATVVRQMFLWLADESLDPANDDPTFTPRLAQSWEFNDDATELTFDLRKDVHWSDGVPVTSEDVRFTWLAQTSPAVAWTYAEFKENIEDVEVLSPSRVRFHFAKASAASMINAIDGGILPAHAWSKLPFEQWRDQPQWFGEHLVTSGPYQLEAWQPRQRLVLKANPSYYQEGIPKIERIVFVNVEDPASRLNQLLAGEIDVLYGISPSSAPRIRADANLHLYAYPSRQFTLIFWNTKRPMFDDPRTRRAIAYAVDRQQIIDVLWGDLAIRHESLISSWHWAHSEIEPLPYDPERSKRLLDEAGWLMQPDGVRQRDGHRFSFELTTNPGNQERWDAQRMIKQDLAAVGIEVHNRRVEYQQLSALNAAHDFDATLTALQMDTSLELGYILHTEAISGGFNFGSFSNAKADAEIEAIRNLTDLREAKQPIAKIEEILRDEQPFLFLWEPKQLLAARKGIQVVTDLVSPLSNLQQWSMGPPQ